MKDFREQAIESEGGDVKTYEFGLSTPSVDSSHKRPKRRQGSIKGGDADNDDEEEDHTFESLADLVQENGDQNDVGGREAGEARSENFDVRHKFNHHQGSAAEQQNEDDDQEEEMLTIEDDVDDHQERDKEADDKTAHHHDQSSLLPVTENETVPAAAAQLLPADVDHRPAAADGGDDQDVVDDAAAADDDAEEEEEIPNPEQVEPPCMFTAEDTIRLHEATLEDKARRLLLADDKMSVGAGGSVGGEPLTDEASSMYVNADESMSELNSVTTSIQSANNNNITLTSKAKEDETVDSQAVSVNITKNVADGPVAGVATKDATLADVPGGGGDNKDQQTLKTDAENKKEPATAASESQSEQEVAETKVTKEEPKKTEQKNPECCLWVSGIPSTIKAADLKSLFSKHGRVISAKVVKIKSKGAVQWYGNITMNSAEEASKCITNLHRTEVHGKSISIERGDGSYPPKRLTAAGGAPSVAAKAPTPGTATAGADQEKVEVPSGEAKPADSGAETVTKASSVKGKKSPSGEEKKKAESIKGDKSKEKREPSKSRSERATRRASSKERRPYRDSTVLSRLEAALKKRPDKKSEDSFRSSRVARAVVNVARRRIITGRGPPPPPPPSSSYRGMRGGPPHRSFPPRRFAPPPPRSSYRGSSRGGPPYRSGPPPFMPPVDLRRQRESDMMERMKYREMEHRQREEKLLIQREKERIRFERERLEREKLELQQVRMQAAYERSAALASTQQMMAAGVKRAYEGLDPYGSQEPASKRANYGGTPSSMATPGGAVSRSSGRRSSPPRSYRGRSSGGGGGDSYRSGGRTAEMSGGGSRYDTPRSSRDSRPSNGGGSGGGGGGYRSSRRSDVPTTPVSSRSSRGGSRYSSPPRRSGGGGQPVAALMGSSHNAPRTSWSGGNAGRQDESMGVYRGSGSSMGIVTSGSSNAGQMRSWQSGSNAAPTSQWRSMASAQMHSQPSGGGLGGMMYGMTSQSSSYPSNEGRFNAYDYTASSTRRY